MTSSFPAAYYVSVIRKGVIHKCVAGIPAASGVDAADAACAADVADAADAAAFGNVYGRPPLIGGRLFACMGLMKLFTELNPRKAKKYWTL